MSQDDSKPKWTPAPAWRFADPPPRHFVKATTCGQARRHHAVTTNWDEVNCPECLKQAPFHRERKGS